MNAGESRLSLLLPFLILACACCVGQKADTLRFDIGAVDKAADPCTDFYQYACGGWLKKNPVPANRPYWAVFQQMREVNEKRVAAILEKSANAAKDPQATSVSEDEKRIGNYYGSCMDEEAIEGKGLAALQPELNKIDTMKGCERSRDRVSPSAHAGNGCALRSLSGSTTGRRFASHFVSGSKWAESAGDQLLHLR